LYIAGIRQSELQEAGMFLITRETILFVVLFAVLYSIQALCFPASLRAKVRWDTRVFRIVLIKNSFGRRMACWLTHNRMHQHQLHATQPGWRSGTGTAFARMIYEPYQSQYSSHSKSNANLRNCTPILCQMVVPRTLRIEGPLAWIR
jgi:hypothetical protein